MNIMKNILIPVLLIFISLSSIKGQDTVKLSLEGAIDKALENNYGIITTEKSKEISELNNNWGNAGALPTIRFVGRSNNSRNFNDTDNYTSSQMSGTVEMNWTIFRGAGEALRRQFGSGGREYHLQCDYELLQYFALAGAAGYRPNQHGALTRPL